MGESPRESGGLGVEGTKSDGVRMLDVARTEVRRGHAEHATREARDEGRSDKRAEVKRSGARISNIKTGDYRVHRSHTYILVSNIGWGRIQSGKRGRGGNESEGERG